MDWSAGAIAVIRALRHRASNDKFISPYETILALGLELLPGQSVLGDAMRNPQTGADLHRVMRDGPFNQAGLSVYGIEFDAAEKARRENVRRVGERHVLAALPTSSMQQYGVNTDALREAVERAELGPGFSPPEIQGRWHGLLETNVIIQFRDVREIIWHEVAGVRKITLWVIGTILNELDDLAARGDSERVREKARTFTRWLRAAALDQALAPEGLPVQDNGNVRLRVWAPQSMAGLRDTDHIEATFGLRERGVPVVIVTGDIGLIARARSSGLQIATPADDPWRLKPELSPREKELEVRLKRAELQKPPGLRLDLQFSTAADAPALDVWLVNAADGGEAKEVLVMWKISGGVNPHVYNRAGGATFGSVPLAADGRFHQQIRVSLPPDGRYQIAQLTFAAPPAEVDYEIWAAGSRRQLGTMRLDGDHYVAADQRQDEAAGAATPAPYGERS